MGLTFVSRNAGKPDLQYRHNMNNHNQSLPARLVFAALLPALALSAACGKNEDKQVATQVAAKVNGDEITVHQINHALAQRENVTPEVAAQAKREILDRLIDQHLATQKAIENKLDRAPHIVQAIEATKREILARAYLEQLATKLPRITPAEIKSFYAEHPELFAQRQLFDMEEFVLATQADVAEGLRQKLAEARSMGEVANWLRSREVNFVANYGVRASEQISVEILPAITAMKQGEIRLFDTGGGRYQVIRLVSTKPSAMDETNASLRIEQYLINRRAGELLANQMKLLREHSKIEFLGEFASSVSTGGAEVKAEGETKALPAAKSKSVLEGLINPR